MGKQRSVADREDKNMAELQGKVKGINVGDDFMFADVEESGTGVMEIVPVWCYFEGDTKPLSYVRTIQNMQFTMLRDAMLNGLTVVVNWNESTGKPNNIKLLGAA
jgi:hypothetical protein